MFDNSFCLGPSVTPYPLLPLQVCSSGSERSAVCIPLLQKAKGSLTVSPSSLFDRSDMTWRERRRLHLSVWVQRSESMAPFRPHKLSHSVRKKLPVWTRINQKMHKLPGNICLFKSWLAQGFLKIFYLHTVTPSCSLCWWNNTCRAWLLPFLNVTRECNHKLFMKMFTEGINQLRVRRNKYYRLINHQRSCPQLDGWENKGLKQTH